MYRLFTLHEATNLLPVVDEHFGALRDAVAEVKRLQAEVSAPTKSAVETLNDMREIAFLVGVVNTNKAELDRLGVMIRDVDAGLVDFPSRLAGEVVCLTWTKGQDVITHYHPLSGDAAMRPLPAANATQSELGDAPAGHRPGPQRPSTVRA